MSSHERAATKHCGGCGETKSSEAFSVNAVWCKTCINAYSKVHYQRNRARILARKAEYRVTHQEQISLGQLRWAEQNRERQRTYLNGYRKINRAKFNAHNARRYARITHSTP
ncbi:MAG: hypothetical protein ACREQ5_10615, partial [Candidatus Dormibacteria bacterium]